MKGPVDPSDTLQQKSLFVNKNIRKQVIHDPSSNMQKLLGQSNPAQNE
jgi:hypothetical protein